jgi:hypothetical protein
MKPKKPNLKLMTKEEIDKRRIKAYTYATDQLKPRVKQAKLMQLIMVNIILAGITLSMIQISIMTRGVGYIIISVISLGLWVTAWNLTKNEISKRITP